MFETKAAGKTAAEAFDAAVKEAQWEHGHGGYSGTIAEKRSFRLLTVPTGMKPLDYARSDAALDLVDDKGGPAGCVALGPGEWLFFGWASS